MNISLYLLVITIAGVIIFFILIAKNGSSGTIYEDIETDEWDCPECGFHSQLGSVCIYCNTTKLEKK